MDTTPEPRKMGRPLGSTRTTRTARLPEVRCTPEQRRLFDQLGGADWLRGEIDRLARLLARPAA